MNLIWVATVCSRMRTDYRFTNTLAWNTFPVAKFTEKNKEDLTRCAEVACPRFHVRIDKIV